MVGVFSRELKVLMLMCEDRILCGSFRAANNVDSRSKGQWPSGLYNVKSLVEKYPPFDSRDGKIGRWFLGFDDFIQENGVKRTAMGLHSGREGVPDGLGRRGYLHATMGCIRTEPSAMEFIATRWEEDPLTHLWVVSSDL